MIFNDKVFDRNVEIKKCFEDGVPLVKFDLDTYSYVNCENPNFEECDLLKIKLPSRDDNKTVDDFLKNNKELLKKLYYKDEQYVIIRIDFYNPFEITYEELSFVEMINRRIEHYAFKGTRDECLNFYNELYKKYDNDRRIMLHVHFSNNDIKDFIYKIKYVHMNNPAFPDEEMNELYNLLYVNNKSWDKYQEEQNRKELEEKDREFNENLIYHMIEDEE